MPRSELGISSSTSECPAESTTDAHKAGQMRVGSAGQQLYGATRIARCRCLVPNAALLRTHTEEPRANTKPAANDPTATPTMARGGSEVLEVRPDELASEELDRWPIEVDARDEGCDVAEEPTVPAGSDVHFVRMLENGSPVDGETRNKISWVLLVGERVMTMTCLKERKKGCRERLRDAGWTCAINTHVHQFDIELGIQCKENDGGTLSSSTRFYRTWHPSAPLHPPLIPTRRMGLSQVTRLSDATSR
ncbi:hypothetical protein LXA43DRAFT_1011662 [Ganoderma leucocontextum]|nr:hypothetical protein LXA43DRAFT_1011662 [Ganoderma leucocontextum]